MYMNIRKLEKLVITYMLDKGMIFYFFSLWRIVTEDAESNCDAQITNKIISIH